MSCLSYVIFSSGWTFSFKLKWLSIKKLWIKIVNSTARPYLIFFPNFCWDYFLSMRRKMDNTIPGPKKTKITQPACSYLVLVDNNSKFWVIWLHVIISQLGLMSDSRCLSRRWDEHVIMVQTDTMMMAFDHLRIYSFAFSSFPAAVTNGIMPAGLLSEVVAGTVVFLQQNKCSTFNRV